MAVDLGSPSLAGWDADSLLDAIVLGGRDDAVAEVCVGGVWTRTRFGDPGPEDPGWYPGLG